MRHHDRYVGCGGHRRVGSRVPDYDDEIGLVTHEIGRKGGEALDSPLSPSVLNGDVLPSTQPRSRSPCRNASQRCETSGVVDGIFPRTPIRYTFACCASPPSGDASTAPRPVTNARRFTARSPDPRAAAATAGS